MEPNIIPTEQNLAQEELNGEQAQETVVSNITAPAEAMDIGVEEAAVMENNNQVCFPVTEDMEMSLSEYLTERRPIPIKILSLRQHLEFLEYVRARPVSQRAGYCRRFLPLNSKRRTAETYSRLEVVKIREGTFGEVADYGSCTRTIYGETTEESPTSSLSLRETIFSPRTLIVVHPFLSFSSSGPSSSPIRCILPTRLSKEPQVYEISRDQENPAQVDVQLKPDFVYEEQLDLDQAEEELERVEEQGETQGTEAVVAAAGSQSSVATESKEGMPCNSESSLQSPDTIKFLAVNSTANIGANSSTVQLSALSSNTSGGLQIAPHQTVLITTGSSGPIVAGHTLITTAPAVIQREVGLQGIGGGKLGIIPVQNARYVVTTTAPLTGVTITSQEAMAKSAEKSGSGDGKGDATTDHETSRPGYLTVCHNCGIQSKNFKVCDSCRKVIPRGSRITPDSLHQSFLSGLKSAPGILSTVTVEKKTPVRKKRAVKHKQPEEITLSSDDESCDSPEKKRKLTVKNCAEGSSEASQEATESVTNGNGNTNPDEELGSDELNKATVDCDDKEIAKIRDEILNKVSSRKSMLYTQLKCRSLRLGTYKFVDSGRTHVHENFQVTITEEGLLFKMPHLQNQTKLIDIVIPKNTILGTVAHFESNRISRFLKIQTSNKFTHWARQVLGMTNKQDPKGWFDSWKGANAEKFVVLILESITPEQVAFVGNCLGIKNIKTVDTVKANEVLMEIAPPTNPIPVPVPRKESPAVVKKVVVVSSNVSINSPVPVQPINPTKVSSSSSKSASSASSSNVIPGIKKINLRSQQDKQANGRLVGNTGDPDFVIDINRTIYSGKSKHLIPLHPGDLQTLRPEQFLNDQIVDFWLQYVYHHVLSEADRQRTHLFSTFFYNRLTTKSIYRMGSDNDKNLSAAEKRHRRVKKWTKNVDLFSKDFIIVPINDSCHWYVAIICFPGLKGPQWMDDGTPIENWQNLTKENGKPKFVRPPGMPPRMDDKPPKRKVKKRPAEELPNDTEPGSDKTVNGSGGNKTDLDGNPVQPAAETATETTGEQEQPKLEKEGAGDVEEKGKAKVGAAQPATPAAKPKSTSKAVMALVNAEEQLFPTSMEDPFKDEAKDDSDEDFLINEYYYTDGDESDEESGEGGKKEKDAESPSKSPREQPEEAAGAAAEAPPEATESPAQPTEVKEEAADTSSSKPGRTDFRIKQPCILLFNSLAGLARTRVFATLRDYLRIEYKERKGEDRPFSKFDMPGFEPNVPQQRNLCDCGVYLVEYVERFFSNPLESYLLALPWSLKKWFPQLKTKRKEMYDKICELIKEENPDNLRYVPKFELPPPPPSPAVVTKEKKSENSKTAAKPNQGDKASSKPSPPGTSAKTESPPVPEPPVEKMDTSEPVSSTTSADASASEVSKAKSPRRSSPVAGKPGDGGVATTQSVNSDSTPPTHISSQATGGVEIPITIIKGDAENPKESPGTTVDEPPLPQSNDLKAATATPAAPSKRVTGKRRSSASKKADDAKTKVDKPDSNSAETSAVEVEAAPRHRLVAVAPEEEPMDIDPVTE